jgi:cobalamin biosynthetic protein CobC
LSMADGCGRQRRNTAFPWRSGWICPLALTRALGPCRRRRLPPGHGCLKTMTAWKWRRAPITGRGTPCHVGVLVPGYAEHAHAWRRAGHSTTLLAHDTIDERLSELDVLVLINPNNPTGQLFEPQTLLAWHERLAVHGGWLIVDEAFMDATPASSLVPFGGRPGLCVLRSLGKFFGLAGARVGFVLVEPALRGRLAEELGPWTVSGPSRYIAQSALADRDWQREMRAWVTDASCRLVELLTRHELAPSGGTALFQWVCTPRAHAIHLVLARQGILTRWFSETLSLRFGLPGNETAWRRLEIALTHLCVHRTAVSRPRTR